MKPLRCFRIETTRTILSEQLLLLHTTSSHIFVMYACYVIFLDSSIFLDNNNRLCIYRLVERPFIKQMFFYLNVKNRQKKLSFENVIIFFSII